MKSEQNYSEREQFMILAPERIRRSRCQAVTKRTKRQCGVPAVRDKRVCRFHGGLSSRAKTKEGRKRCGISKTVRGGETRVIRAARPA